MALQLHSHPLASFCHKVLIALYEREIAFEAVMVDLGDPKAAAAFRKISPMGKMPVLVDEERGETVAETTIILEYLEERFPERAPLLPRGPSLARKARYWDRFYDFSVELPMQKIVGDRLRPEGAGDAFGVEQARGQLREAYAVIDAAMSTREWATGADFSIADCAAEPALFYANTVEPIDDAFPDAKAYLRRLMLRPSAARVLKEAAPYFHFFPMPVKPDISMLP